VLKRLSADLTRRFGRGFGPVNLNEMKRFFLAWPAEAICRTVSETSVGSNQSEIFQTLSEKSSTDATGGQPLQTSGKFVHLIS
jgi:hypothetical protein